MLSYNWWMLLIVCHILYLLTVWFLSFLFDWSSGPTKMRPDGLNISNMNASYGCAVASMWDTNVAEVGPYTLVLAVGNIQSLSFPESSQEPFWMDETEK